MGQTTERRPAGRDGVPDDARGDGTGASVTDLRETRCLLLRAALKARDPAAVAAVLKVHPHCARDAS